MCVTSQPITEPGKRWRPIRTKETSPPSNTRANQKWRFLLSCCLPPIASWLQVGNGLMQACTHRHLWQYYWNTASRSFITCKTQLYMEAYFFDISPQHDYLNKMSGRNELCYVAKWLAKQARRCWEEVFMCLFMLKIYLRSKQYVCLCWLPLEDSGLWPAGCDASPLLQIIWEHVAS